MAAAGREKGRLGSFRLPALGEVEVEHHGEIIHSRGD